MKMKQRFGAVLFSAALLLALAGCSGSAGSAPSGSSAAASSAAPSVSSGQSAASTASEAASGSTAASEAAALPFFGVWEVTPNVEFSSVSALSVEDAQKYVGAKVEYRADAVLCNGETVASGALDYTAVPYDEAKLVDEFRVNLGEWWNAIVSVGFVEPDTASIDGFGTQFFVADDHTLWIYHEGVFFLARPAA